MIEEERYCPLTTHMCDKKCVFRMAKHRNCWLFFVLKEYWYKVLSEKKVAD